MFEWAKVNIGLGEKQLDPFAEPREKALKSHYFSSFVGKVILVKSKSSQKKNLFLDTFKCLLL